jgi:hypothetical protein
MEDLRQSDPAMVLISGLQCPLCPPSPSFREFYLSWPPFRQVLEERYAPVGEIDGFAVYRRVRPDMKFAGVL